MVTVIAVVFAGAVAGCLGALLGIGGAVFLVPFLNLAVGLPIAYAAGIGLITAIGTSSAVSARTAGQGLMNARLAMVLMTASTAGALGSGLAVDLVSDRARERLFGIVAGAIALVMLGRLERRNVILDPQADPGPLGGRYDEAESGGVVTYRVRRLPVGLAVSLVAGVVSSVLGIGGGILQVPALNAWCGVPLRAAAATSALMIGVTAVAAAPLYYARGQILPHLAAAAVLGVLAGSRMGFWVGERVRAKGLKALMAGVLAAVAISYLVRG
jgi:uncharacterized membrane protein YfcA